MSLREPSFTIGVEEEYYLVDIESGELITEQPPELLEECRDMLGAHVAPEFQQCQIEIDTPICHDMKEVRRELARLRSGVARSARRHGAAPIAASTHPFGKWNRQEHTPKQRYNMLADDMKIAARRLLICGMHVHVGVEDKELRIDLLNQASYFLPHLLALSASSPFWRGEDTGLSAYRLSVFDEMPRTGLPEQISSWGEYRRMVDLLIDNKIIDDASMIWWDLRPSEKYPTLEMRICDVATRIDDAVAIAALFRCVLRMLYRLRRDNQRWRTYAAFLIRENRWRAQRYGVGGGMIDFGRGELVSYGELIDELIELVARDAAFFGCEREVAHCRKIAREGTSADRQVRLYEQLLDKGMGKRKALREVVHMLRKESLAGID
jgi:carboxylate-amine ligase